MTHDSFERIWRSLARRLVLALIGVLAVVTDEPGAADNVRGENDGRSAPFFMFTTSKFANDGERDGVLSALLQHVTNRDYLGLRLAQEVPELGDRVGRAHLYVLPPSLGDVQRQSARGREPGTPGLIVYDPEHWPQTPGEELADVPAAIASGKVLARKSGCHDYGIAPDGWLIGIKPDTCGYDLSAGIHRTVDWDGIALFDIQAQRLLGEECVSHSGTDAYVGLVAAIAHEVRARAQDLKIVAQLSFRFTAPERMLAAIERLRGIADGFYIAYPRDVGQACSYCSPRNLDRVLAAIRG